MTNVAEYYLAIRSAQIAKKQHNLQNQLLTETLRIEQERKLHAEQLALGRTEHLNKLANERREQLNQVEVNRLNKLALETNLLIRKQDLTNAAVIYPLANYISRSYTMTQQSVPYIFALRSLGMTSYPLLGSISNVEPANSKLFENYHYRTYKHLSYLALDGNRHYQATVVAGLQLFLVQLGCDANDHQIKGLEVIKNQRVDGQIPQGFIRYFSKLMSVAIASISLIGERKSQYQFSTAKSFNREHYEHLKQSKSFESLLFNTYCPSDFSCESELNACAGINSFLHSHIDIHLGNFRTTINEDNSALRAGIFNPLDVLKSQLGDSEFKYVSRCFSLIKHDFSGTLNREDKLALLQFSEVYPILYIVGYTLALSLRMNPSLIKGVSIRLTDMLTAKECIVKRATRSINNVNMPDVKAVLDLNKYFPELNGYAKKFNISESYVLGHELYEILEILGVDLDDTYKIDGNTGNSLQMRSYCNIILNEGHFPAFNKLMIDRRAHVPKNLPMNPLAAIFNKRLNMKLSESFEVTPANKEDR